jgi:hypothetical protein
MLKNYVFWTHGVNVQFGDDRPIVNSSRHGFGTKVDQRKIPDPEGHYISTNWFHFAVPTPTEIEDKDTTCSQVYVKAICADATIKSIHIYDGENKIIGRDDLNEQSVVNYTYNIDPMKKIKSGLGVSLYVDFAPERPPQDDTDLGHVTFNAVGARFVIQD